jgi:hypothetical protein
MMRLPRSNLGVSEYALEGIVLSVAPSRDDLIARLLSGTGEVRAVIAPQARGRPRRGEEPARAVLQPLSAVALTVRTRPGEAEDDGLLPRVGGARLLEAHLGVKSDPEKVAAAMCMVEAIVHLVPDGAAEPDLPALFARALARLDAAPPTASGDLLALFLLRLLALSGLLPELGPELALPPAARAALESWQAGRFRPLPAEAAQLTLRWFEHQITAASQRPFRSLGVFESLRGEGPSPPAPR